MNAFYIIHSISLDKYYCGITHDDVDSRVLKHNEGTYGNHFTSIANDWRIKLIIQCSSFAHARRLELFVKRMKSRKFIERLINENDLVEAIKLKTQ